MTGRVPLATKFFFGSGSVAEGTKNAAFNTFLLFYYNQVLGLSGTACGAAIFLALCVDAVTDPLVGSLSDGWRSRLGRRHPFMYAAALPMAVCFFLLFNPPAALGTQGLFGWLLVFAVGVRVSMTLYQIPSAAMLPELTPDYDERTSLVSWRFLFGWFGGLSISLLGYRYFFASSDTVTDGRLDATAYGGFGLLCAVLVAAAILICAAGTHGLIPRLLHPQGGAPFTLGRFAGEARDVLRNPSYRVLIVAGVFAAVAGGFSDVVGLFVNTYFWEFSTQQIEVLVLALGIAVIVAFAGARPLSARYDKKRAGLGLASFAVLFGPLPIFLRLLGWMPPNGDPLLLPLIALHAIVLVSCAIIISIIFASMIADVVDEGELDTGRRQEGMFTSTIAFTMKATSGLGGFIAGAALDVIAFPQGAEPGSVPPDKVAALGLAVGPGLMLLYLVTLVFLSRYRISRSRHETILAELARRRGVVSAAAKVEGPPAGAGGG